MSQVIFDHVNVFDYVILSENKCATNICISQYFLETKIKQ